MRSHVNISLDIFTAFGDGLTLNMKTILLVLVCAAVASAQKCKLSSMPKQISGMQYTITGLVEGGAPPQALRLIGQYASDADKMISGGVQQIDAGHYQVEQKYYINMTTGEGMAGQSGKCYRFHVPASHNYMEQAAYTGEAYIGTSAGGLHVEGYKGPIKPTPTSHMSGSFVIALETENCTPATMDQSFVIMEGGRRKSQVTSSTFLNTTMTISDPKLLEIPVECK